MHLCIYLAVYTSMFLNHSEYFRAYATAAVGICVVSILMEVSVLSHAAIALWASASTSASEQAQTSICTHTCFVSCSLFVINLKQSSCLFHVTLMVLHKGEGGVAVCRDSSINCFPKSFCLCKRLLPFRMFVCVFSNACIVR